MGWHAGSAKLTGVATVCWCLRGRERVERARAPPPPQQWIEGIWVVLGWGHASSSTFLDSYSVTLLSSFVRSG